MTMISKIFNPAALLLALSLVSCVKEIPALSPEGRKAASYKPMIFVSSGATVDSISLFDGIAMRKFDRKMGPAGMSYYGEAVDSGLYYAVAPFSASHKMQAGKVQMSIPKHQNACPGALDTLHSVFAGTTTGTELELTRLSSAVALTLEPSGITSITLRGNKTERLAGACAVNFNDGVEIEPIEGGDAVYSVELSSTSAPLAAGKYYFSILPSEFKDGVSLSFTRSQDSKIAVIKNILSAEARSGGVYDFGNVTAEDLIWNDIISLIFMESPAATSVEWPFNESQGSTGLTTKKGGYSFSVSATSLNTTVTGAGFVFGPAAGDYLALPHFQGKALTSVRLVTGNADASGGSPAIKKEDGTVVGQAWTGAKTAGTENVWTFRGEENLPLRLQLTEAAGEQGCAIQILELQYREARENEYFVDEVKTGETVECNSSNGKAKTSVTFSMSRPDLSKYSVGVEYRDTTSAEWQTLTVQPDSTTVDIFVTGLQKGQVYELRAWAKGTDDKAPKYGNSVVFTQQTAIKMIFGNESTSATDYYDRWKALWNLSTSSSAGVLGPDDKTYHYCDTTFNFKLWSSCGYGYRVASKKYYGLCLAYAGSGKTNYNGWMKLPAVPGLKLSKIKCTMQGAANYDITVSSDVDATTGVPVSSVGYVSITGSSKKEYSISTKNAQIGQSYYLCTGTGPAMTDSAIGRMATFEVLTIIYE